MYFTQGAFWYLLVLCSGLIGYTFSRNISLYKKTRRPRFAPKPIVFKIVWPILYILQATATLLYQRDGIADQWSVGLTLFIVYTAISTLFSPLFFTFKQIFLSWVVVVASFALSVYITVEYFLDSTIAGCLFLPTNIWLAFATLIMTSIFYFKDIAPSGKNLRKAKTSFSTSKKVKSDIEVLYNNQS